MRDHCPSVRNVHFRLPSVAQKRCMLKLLINNNDENSDSSHFYYNILIVRIESLRSEAESSAGKKQSFNVSI